MTRRLLIVACFVLAGIVFVGAASPGTPAQGSEVGIFYYPWWGTPERDGRWFHWSQNGTVPPAEIASAFYPSRGAYSSADRSVVRAQMREIADAGIDTVIVSWWGWGSLEDSRLLLATKEARAARLRVAVHLEPWAGRTPWTAVEAMHVLHARGLNEFYVYDSTRDPDADWAAALATIPGAVVYANTGFVGKAQRGGFDGVYTYDVFIHTGGGFARLCRQAHRVGLLCAPSVGPGYDAFRATGDQRRKLRGRGARYDAMWERAIRSRPDAVTITSYNEWHEGTQIEPARVSGWPYLSYEGDYGLTGEAAERAYLDRTLYWAQRLHASRR
jgi:glycoprotein endo-alpha-1,2-mannosidase